MALTDIEIKNAKAQEKAYQITDSLGLCLSVSPKGVKSWRQRIRSGGKEKILTIGRYPEIGIKAARAKRDELRGKYLKGINDEPVPSPSFHEVAILWHKRNLPRWRPKHAARVMKTLEVEVFPSLGSDPISEIGGRQVMDLLMAIEARGVHDHAHDMRQRISGVFDFAVAAGMCQSNPAASMRKVLMPIPKAKPRAALVTLEEAQKMLSKAEAIPAQPITRLALRLLALTALRPGEVRYAEWSEFHDLDGKEPMWCVPAERMKMKRPHFVPLSRQAVEAIEVLRSLSGGLAIAFPSPSSLKRPISENAFGYLLNRAGYYGRQTGHGFRATFSTIMNGRFPQDAKIIDMMLSHAKEDQIEAAYNRAEHMERRRELAQQWADLLLDGRPPAIELLDIPRRSVGISSSEGQEAA